jgi:hypothetical protein
LRIANGKLQIVRHLLWFLTAGIVASAIHTGAAAAPFTFGDIRFWVGAGENRAALVIDWQENAGEPPALVWGYRWSGMATGADMLMAVLAADDRLFAKLGGTLSNPQALYGLGYDDDGDRRFGLDDGTVFDAAGIALTGPADSAGANDPGDLYAEGWLAGFWHYGVASTNPFDGGNWYDTPLGMAGRALVDGAWDSWAFESPITFTAFATNPTAAPSPYAAGDYDRNSRVDAGDYHRWKSLFGSTTDPSADGNYDGRVDAADFTVWRDHLENASGLSAGASANVPEPVTARLVLVALVLIGLTRRRTP